MNESEIREPSEARTRTLADYFGVLRRRKRIVIQAAIIVPLVAVFVAMLQDQSYRATAEVLLSRQNLASQLRNFADPGVSDPVRFAQTQADLARSPDLAARVADVAGVPGLSALELLRASSVTPKSNSDLLVFSVENRDSANAVSLANSYAREFTIFRRGLDTATLKRAEKQLQARIQTTAANERPQLVALLEELKLMEALQTSNTFLARPSGRAEQVAPKPRQYGAIGAFLGILLGIVLAFVLEAVDKRVRNEEEIEERLGMYLLGRIPEPPDRVKQRPGLVMIDEPNSADGEAFRVLRTNLEFVNLDREARTIMLTSAGRGEGKSMTVANLAVAFARAGKRVALVDLDVRRPTIHKLFGIRSRPGLTDVVLGHANPESASKVVAGVEVLPAGFMPPNPGEFVGFRDVAHVLDELSKRVDLVLVDTPPLLAVGDALTLTAKVDAVVVVIPPNPPRPLLAELRRVLETSPAAKLGFVLTGAKREDRAYGYLPGEMEQAQQEPIYPTFRRRSDVHGGTGVPTPDSPTFSSRQGSSSPAP